MPKPSLPSSTFAIALCGLLLGSSALGAEDAQTPSDSRYPSGPPPVTDGYTDTSQGGTKTSGDAPIPPASKDGEVVTFEGRPEVQPPATPDPTK